MPADVKLLAHPIPQPHNGNPNPALRLLPQRLPTYATEILPSGQQQGSQQLAAPKQASDARESPLPGGTATTAILPPGSSEPFSSLADSYIHHPATIPTGNVVGAQGTIPAFRGSLPTGNAGLQLTIPSGVIQTPATAAAINVAAVVAGITAAAPTAAGQVETPCDADSTSYEGEKTTQRQNGPFSTGIGGPAGG